MEQTETRETHKKRDLKRVPEIEEFVHRVIQNANNTSMREKVSRSQNDP